MRAICNIACLIGATVAALQAAAPDSERERQILAQLQSIEILEVENALTAIQTELLSGPRILQSLYVMLDDPRPDRRLSRDVIGQSPSKRAYEALAAVSGFRPSQPSLLFEESKMEIKVFVQRKYPNVVSGSQHLAKLNPALSQERIVSPQATRVVTNAFNSVNDPPAPQQAALPNQAAKLVEQANSGASAQMASEARSTGYALPVASMIVLGALTLGMVFYLLRRKAE